MTMALSRRRFLASIGAAAAGVLVIDDAGAAPPKETGLSHEGLLARNPGFQPRTSMPLPKEELPGFLSREQLSAHHAEYVRLVDRLREIEKGLGRGEADAAKYGDLRRAQVAAANGVLLHEFYFTGIGVAKVEPPRDIVGHMTEHMGPWESWREDFRQCALVAKAWATLVYDPYDDRWHNAVMESDSDGVWVGANLLVVCDVSAHAYSKDYQRREDYIAKFLEHIDWEQISRRYRAVDRM